MFRAQASRSPDATAVRDGDREMGYAELDSRSARLARSLNERGISRGHLVAVVLDRSVDLVVAFLAVLRSGAAYVPVSPADPADRVALLLEDAQPSMVITSVRQASRMPWLDPGLVHLVNGGSGRAADHDLARETGTAVLPSSLTPSDAAYVIYTSGSTGRPKGVVVEHGALSSYLRYVVASYPSVAGRALFHSSVSFDMAVTSLYGPLLTGGTVDIVDLRAIGANPVPAAGAGSPSFLKVTPSHLALLRALPDWCSPTGHLVIGGEALATAQLRPWWAEHGTVTIVNEYGPTEATVGCCVYQARPGDVVDGPHVPIGRPTTGTGLYVLDEWLKPVPAGRTGELHITGPQLARGYLGRPGATATAFVADPFGPRGGRMYRTGDLVRKRADGSLEFLGRADDQIKINGFRVEPGEIQAVLVDHDLVAQAFVTVRGTGAESKRLTAYVVPAGGGGPLDPRELRRFAASRLPEHMVPVDLVSLPALPLTANGKVDRDALPGPRPRDGGDAPVAGTAEERLLCRMVADLTSVPTVSVDDDFFQLGGSSIAAARLVTRARREGVGLTLETVLKGRTIRRMLARRDADSLETQ
nr:non-ribosomal peptide synthetase [Streptosporangium amethystogenes]